MKKIIALLLVLSSLLTLSACKRYPAVKSTDEEAATVMTLSIDGNTYNVPYELYRTFFLTYKSQVDGGNAGVWTSDNKNEYVERINGLILDRITEIYAAFAMCERIGFDIYSKDVEKKIKSNVKESVEKKISEAELIGIDDYDYDRYLADLKDNYMNYSVQTIMFRYAIAVDAIDAYYIGTANPDEVSYGMSLGELKYTKEDVRNFYFSDSCVRVLRASFQKGISYTPLEQAEELKATLQNAADGESTPEAKEAAVCKAILGSGYFSYGGEVENGYVIGKYSLESSYFGNMTEAVFSVEEGEVTNPISVVTDEENSYYVIYRTYKSDADFETSYNSSYYYSVRYVYLQNRLGEISTGVADQLRSSVSYTDVLYNIDYSKIGM